MEIKAPFQYLDLPLPEKAHTRDGLSWCPKDEVWHFADLPKDFDFNFLRLKRISNENLLLSIKHVLIVFLNKFSISYASNCFSRLVHLIKFARKINKRSIDHFSLATIMAYRTTLISRREWYLGNLVSFFEIWVNLGFAGIDLEVIEWLNEITLKGGPKGEAVLTANPTKGPLTDNEFQAVLAALDGAFAKNEINLEEYILIWLYLAFGARSVQLAALKIKDFKKIELPSGVNNYIIYMPRAKQRNRPSRKQFKIRKLVTNIGILLEALIADIAVKWAQLEVNIADLPIFVDPGSSSMIDEFRYHSTSVILSDRVISIFRKLAIYSERTGELLKITTYRFRYTLGTRAAAEGASELIIAEMLDHSDTQNVGVYVKAVPEIVERIDMAMALHLAPMAKAFAGQLIGGEADSRRVGDQRSLIVTPDSPADTLGSCGICGSCTAFAPIACYTCRSYQPWRNGPHLNYLHSLLRERERILAETGDIRIASINDRTILACAQVVQMCNESTGSTGSTEEP